MVKVPCPQCGKKLNAPEDSMGKRAKCPACQSVFALTQPPPGAAAPAVPPPPVPLAPEPAPAIPLSPESTAVPLRAGAIADELRSPGMPVCCLELSADGADINVDFDIASILDAFVQTFVKVARKTFDVQLGPAPPDCPMRAVVRIVRMDKGARWMRYFLLFVGSTRLAIEGEVIAQTGESMPLVLEQRGSWGLFGGSSRGLLISTARILGRRVAKKAKKHLKYGQ